MKWEEPARYIGYCCREWILAVGSSTMAPCGLCGEKPEFLRPWSEDEERNL